MGGNSGAGLRTGRPNRHGRAPTVMAVPQSSWPGLTRPSMQHGAARDGRDKTSHDWSGRPAPVSQSFYRPVSPSSQKSPRENSRQRPAANCPLGMGCCLPLGSSRNGGRNWCMRFRQHRLVMSAQAHSDGAAAEGERIGTCGSATQRSGSRPAASGTRRSKQGFNADTGRCTQNTQMGHGPPHRQGSPWRGAAVNHHAALRPIRVFCVHRLLHLRKNSCLLRRVPHWPARKKAAHRTRRSAACLRNTASGQGDHGTVVLVHDVCRDRRPEENNPIYIALHHGTVLSYSPHGDVHH